MTRRYLMDFKVNLQETESYDCIIIGSGIAGLFTALSLPESFRILILTKSDLMDSNSSLAQGGIAAAMSKSDIEPHIADTLRAGSSYNDLSAVEAMIGEAQERIEDLLALGVDFDRNEDGVLLATKEGGHSARRVLHYKDYTGEAVTRGLLQAAELRENIQFAQHTLAVDILEKDNEAVGVITVLGGVLKVFSSRKVVLATGGIGGLYDATTNTAILTGDGLGMALRATVRIKDMEFIQFHPTAFHQENKTFLISEAVRGEGGYLINSMGHRFMDGLHPMKELAPRDVVSKAMYDQMNSGSSIYLDVCHMGAEFLTTRFPTIYENCLQAGFDMAKTPVPVRPVQHYIMGGVETDTQGQTSLKGLYACGEVARTGVHGANRLASNSLLEAIVYARRVASAVEAVQDKRPVHGIIESNHQAFNQFDAQSVKEAVREILSTSAFIIREPDRVKEGLEKIKTLKRDMAFSSIKTSDEIEAANMLIVADEILVAAASREKTLGSHIVYDKGE